MSSFDSPQRQGRSLQGQPFYGRAAPAQQFPLTPQMAAMPALTGPVLEQADRRFDQMTNKVQELEQKVNLTEQAVMAIKQQADQKVDEIAVKQRSDEVRIGLIEQEIIKHMADMTQKMATADQNVMTMI